MDINHLQPETHRKPADSVLDPLSVIVQVEHYTDDGFSGVAQPLCCGVEPFSFHNFSQLITLLDELCDRVGHPVRETSLNQFSGGRDQPLPFVPAQPTFEKKMGHFTVEIVHRRNQTMQGRVIVGSRGEIPAGRQSFRSDIELLRLMRQYMKA